MSKPSDKYTEGFSFTYVHHMPEVSSYNHNFYTNNKDLLFAKSDDDNTTEWYLVTGKDYGYLGYSYTYESDNHLYKGPNT